MVDEVIVVFPRPFVLERFPGEDVAEGIVAPSFETREMSVCICYREGAINEGGRVGVKEVIFDMGWNIRMGGEFGVAGEVEAVEVDLAVVRVAEGGAVDAEAQGGHGLSRMGWGGLDVRLLYCILALY